MTETLRAYRYALDPTPAQVEILQRYATAARCGYNFALGYMVAVHQKARGRDALIASGMDKAVATEVRPCRLPPLQAARPRPRAVPAGPQREEAGDQV
ncbi:helix-turn-helix domain-containing protein [Streptomyces sp. NPDC003038]|uniref:helix-turn-helix domain-containing protein n=1 Tax=unclassified Streptomyces TaxID=2593676 RepID=UPI0033AF4D5A